VSIPAKEKQAAAPGGSVLAPKTPPDVGARSQRRRIIESMLERCAEKTYAHTTIGDIVSGARISRSTFYKRFADKRACFEATVEHCLEDLTRTAREAQEPGRPPAERLRAAIAAVLARMAERPAIGKLLSADAVALDPTVTDRYRRLVGPVVERLWFEGARPRDAGSDPGLALGRARLLIFDLIAAGRASELPRLLPELTYLTLLPYAGHEEALREADAAARSLERGAVAGAGDGAR